MKRIAMLVFVAMVLAMNAHWFQAPIVEGSDFAANSLQVDSAKHFRELLGNYSRWHFHHPGPAFMYLLALGEVILHDAAHLVPGTFNAQLVTLVLLNTAFLFGAIAILERHFRGPVFAPLALTGALLMIWAVNRTIPTGAMVSPWMPHVALFPFLFFAAACAGVAAGEMADLPWMTLGAMLMVHLHVSQLMFAGVLSVSALGLGMLRNRPNAKTVAICGAIVVVFAVPVAIELAVDRPNNLDDIRAYLATYPHPHRGIATAAAYFGSFLAFLPELKPAAPVPWYAIVYWSAFVALAAAAVIRRQRPPRFAWILGGECVLIAMLFFVWADRITGDLYNFNGFFIYGLPLLAWFAIAGTAAQHWKLPRTVWLLPAAVLVAIAPQLRNPDRGSDAIRRISDSLRPLGSVELVFQHDDWDTAAGVANQLARRGQPVCVDAGWEFMFGRRYGCKPGAVVTRRVIAPAAAYEPGRRPLAAPFAIGPDDVNALWQGFLPCESDHCWTGRTASITFAVARPGPYKMAISGSVLPERDTRLSLNGTNIGTLAGLWKSGVTFDVTLQDRNVLTFDCPNAGPITGDDRTLGFSLMAVECRP